MKRTKIIRILAAIMMIVMSISLIGCAGSGKSESKGDKNITIVVTHADGKTAQFDYQTSKETLAEVLLENKLVEGEDSDYGLFITKVDNEEADSSKEQWWCITKNGGETLNTGADSTIIADGETYELTLTTGY